MKIRTTLTAIAAAAVLPAGLTLVGTPAQAAPATYQYNFQEQHASETFTDVGICDPGPATIELLDYNEALHVTANEAGLSQDEIEALLESEQDNGVITKLSYTQTGSFRVTEADGRVYTGHFTTWFGGNANRTTQVFSGTFNLTGTSADGRQIKSHGVSHVTFKNGEPVVEFDKSNTTGC